MIPVDVAPNLIQQAFERILAAIVDGTLAPGDRIRQQDLAGRLGVSRQPISHALHLLHRQGLVTESGKKGFRVSPLDPARIRQLYEVRGALDGLAARLSAGRASNAEGRTALEAALAAGEAVHPEARLSELIALDADFHGALYACSGNPAIAEMAAPHWPQMRRSMAAVLTDGPYRAKVWEEHRAIVERVLAGDAAGASAAAEAHALRAGTSLADKLTTLQQAA